MTDFTTIIDLLFQVFYTTLWGNITLVIAFLALMFGIALAIHRASGVVWLAVMVPFTLFFFTVYLTSQTNSILFMILIVIALILTLAYFKFLRS